MTEPAATTTSHDILGGIKVLELAQNAAIPYCGRLLAGLGADVIKVEPPQGDAMRATAAIGSRESKAYATINPGKRAIVLDVAAPEAKPIIEALFRWADVAIVAFKGSDLARYGIDWEQAKAINPTLIHLTHTPFGPAGPDADLGGYDVLVQGRSGVGFIMNRSGDNAPQPTRPAINDFGTGITSAFAVMAGLRHRDQTGEGQRIDTSLLGTATALGTPLLSLFPDVDSEALEELDEDLAMARQAGVDFDTQREMYESRVLAGHGAFRLYFRHYATADGLISVAGMSAGLFTKFHDVTGIPAPGGVDHTTPEFAATVQRAEELFLTAPTQEWIDRLRAVGYPCGPYHMPHQALDDPQMRANDFAVDLDHPVLGSYTTTGMPLQFEKATSALRGPSPTFGQHSREVMIELGLDAEHVEELVESGVLLDGSGDES